MYLAGVPVYTIMLIVRWSSNAFLQYIWKQIKQCLRHVAKQCSLTTLFKWFPRLYLAWYRKRTPRQCNHRDNAKTRRNIGRNVSQQVQLPAVLFFSWSANDTGANYWRRHHLTNRWRHWERGELNSKNSIPNQTPECTSCAPTSNSRIGEAFGFKVTSLFGHWTRRERVETHRPKNSNHWAMYSKLRRDKIGMRSLIFTSLFDCNGPSNQSMQLN